MNSWLDYHAGFTELATDTKETVLELQFGDGSEEWLLDGGSDIAQQRVIELCRQAGQSLVSVHLSDHETGSLVAPEYRWFRLLRERNNPSESSPLVIDRAGVAISTWTLIEMAERSAELCEDLHRTNPIQQTSSGLLKKFREDPHGTALKIVGVVVVLVILVRLGLR